MITYTDSFASCSINDLEKAKSFYAQVLGLSVSETDEGLSVVLPGGGTMFLYPKEDHVPATYTVLNFSVPSIDEAVTQLTELGVTLERYEGMEQDEHGIMRGKSAGQGPDIAWFTDPSGNILSVLEG